VGQCGKFARDSLASFSKFQRLAFVGTSNDEMLLGVGDRSSDEVVDRWRRKDRRRRVSPEVSPTLVLDDKRDVCDCSALVGGELGLTAFLAGMRMVSNEFLEGEADRFV
jgi:hypothetical protein